MDVHHTREVRDAWTDIMLHAHNVEPDENVTRCHMCGCKHVERFLVESLQRYLRRGEVAVDYLCPDCCSRWLVLYEHLEQEDELRYVPMGRWVCSAADRAVPPLDWTRRVLTDSERRDALDALAKTYSQEPDAVDLINLHRDEQWFTESGLDSLEAALSLYFVKDEGDWRESIAQQVQESED